MSLFTKLFIKAFLSFLIFSSSSAFAESLVCSMPNAPSVSKMRIDYNDSFVPEKIFLQSPGSDFYRELAVDIKPVFKRDQNGYEAFSVTPVFNQVIDWDSEVNCFKEVGTQWYFQFRHFDKNFNVQFSPYFIKSFEQCFLPRFSPQAHPLNCSIKL